MQRLDIKDILEATGGRLICGEPDFVVSEITTDSRKAGVNMLFVPIVGENHDAHDYIGSAFENGASAVITHRDIPAREGKNIIRVMDTRTALGDIARYYKEKYNLPTVAVTGSVGKTTAKDRPHGHCGFCRRKLHAVPSDHGSRHAHQPDEGCADRPYRRRYGYR